MALLGGLSQTKLISYACEKDEYLIVNDNKDYEPKRYASAKAVVNNVLNNYLQGKEGSINDFILSE